MEEKKPKAIPQLSPDGLKAFDYISTKHDALVGYGLQPEDLLNPAYWAHHGVKLRPMDEIRARAEDGTWVAYLLVLASDRTWARVTIDRVLKLTTADVSMTQATEEELKRLKSEYTISFSGPEKYRVIRKSDKNVMKAGLEQKGDAELWLDKHLRDQLGAPPAPATVAST